MFVKRPAYHRMIYDLKIDALRSLHRAEKMCTLLKPVTRVHLDAITHGVHQGIYQLLINDHYPRMLF